MLLHILQFFANVLFDLICGFIGYWSIRILTLGRIQPDPMMRGQSVFHSWVGLGVVLAIGATTLFMILMPGESTPD